MNIFSNSNSRSLWLNPLCIVPKNQISPTRWRWQRVKFVKWKKTAKIIIRCLGVNGHSRCGRTEGDWNLERVKIFHERVLNHQPFIPAKLRATASLNYHTCPIVPAFEYLLPHTLSLGAYDDKLIIAFRRRSFLKLGRFPARRVDDSQGI